MLKNFFKKFKNFLILLDMGGGHLKYILVEKSKGSAMNKKVKLVFSFVTLCFALSVLCFGVISAVSVTFTISGNINYDSSAEQPEPITDMTFSFDEQNKTATLTSYTGTATSVDIPSTIGRVDGHSEITYGPYENLQTVQDEQDLFKQSMLMYGISNISYSISYSNDEDDKIDRTETNQLFTLWVSKNFNMETYEPVDPNVTISNISFTFPSEYEFDSDYIIDIFNEEIVVSKPDIAVPFLMGPIFAYIYYAQEVVGDETLLENIPMSYDIVLTFDNEPNSPYTYNVNNSTWQEILMSSTSDYQSKIMGAFEIDESTGQPTGVKNQFTLNFENIVYDKLDIPIITTGTDYKVTGIGNAPELNTGLADYSLDSIIIAKPVFPSYVDNINLPNTLTYIEYGAFDGTNWLTNLCNDPNFEGKVVAKDKTTKYYIKAPSLEITSVDVSDVQVIAGGAFMNCTKLSSKIEIPQGQTVISACTFGNTNFNLIKSASSSLVVLILFTEIFGDANLFSQIIIPDSVTKIGDFAFAFCANLSLSLPDSIESLGNYSFFACKSLNINLPPNLSSIGKWCFAWCNSLTKIDIPENITTIKTGTFANCSNLTSVTISSGVSTIEDGAFDLCSSLVEIYNYSTINIDSSSSVGGLGKYAKEVYNLNESSGPKPETRIHREDDMQYWVNDDGSYIALTPSVDVLKLAEVNLHENTVEIASGAFSNCLNLTSITINRNLKTIPDDAFSSCNVLTEVYNYSNLNVLVSTAKVIYNKDDLGENPPSTRILRTNNIQYFRNDDNTLIALAPVNRYILTKIDLEDLEEGTVEINPSAFSFCYNLDEITIPDKFASSSLGFVFDASLTKINLPSTMTSIADLAFLCCPSLTSITIPDSVTSIGDQAFSYCYALQSVYINGQNVVNMLDGTGSNDAGGLLDNISSGEKIYIKSGLSVTSYIEQNFKLIGTENGYNVYECI